MLSAVVEPTGYLNLKYQGLLLLALYLVASALTKFDTAKLSTLEVIGRLLVAVLLLIKSPYICTTAFIVGIMIIIFHKLWFRKRSDPKEN